MTGGTLPVLVLEIGWPSESTEADNMQLDFVKKLPEHFEGVHPVAVCWDVVRDPSDAYKRLIPRLSSNGLLTQEGMRKKGYFEWERLQKNSPPPEAPKGHKRVLSEGVPLPPPISAERAVGLTPPIRGWLLLFVD